MNKIFNLLGIKNEGWRRVTKVIYPIYIFIVWFNLADGPMGDIIEQYPLTLGLATMFFIFVIKSLDWITDGFKKDFK